MIDTYASLKPCKLCFTYDNIDHAYEIKGNYGLSLFNCITFLINKSSLIHAFINNAKLFSS